MTSRPLLDSSRIDASAAKKMSEFHPDVVREVKEAIARSAVVVVGMAQNPHVRRVRRALTEARIEFEYLEYGSYFSQWKRRLAIKLWSGWPTFPQVFARGTLVGGEDLTKAAIADGSLAARVAGGEAAERGSSDSRPVTRDTE